jgi:hypothetical protein
MKKGSFLNKNAMNTAKGMRKVEHAKITPKHIDVYLDAEARDDDPERTDLKRDETSVRPESKYYKSLDPLKLGGIKVSPKPNVFADLTPGTGPMKVELQKHHLQRATYRLTAAKKKQAFEDLLNNYFHVNLLDTAKEQLNQLLNTPIRPLTEPEMNNIEAQLRSHDARLLNDTNALMHIIFDSRLLAAARNTLTNDQWSQLLKYALLSLYQRSAQPPPPWLGHAHVKDTTGVVHDDIPVAEVYSMPNTKTDKYGSQPNPEKTTQHQEEAAEAMPVKPQSSKTYPTSGKRMGFKLYYNQILNLLKEGADDSLIQEAQKMLNMSPHLPQAFITDIVSNAKLRTLQPGTLNAQIAVELIRRVFVDIYVNNRPAQYTKAMLNAMREAVTFFFREKETP